MSEVAIFLPSLEGGGAERTMVDLAVALTAHGVSVDLVLASAKGHYLSMVPRHVDIVDLGARRMITCLPALVRYLQTARPESLLSALDHANIIALIARRLARSPCRAVISVRVVLSLNSAAAESYRGRLLPLLARRCYHWADAIVAVSRDVAEDLVSVTRLPRESITVVHNPVVTPELEKQMRAPLDHPWLRPGMPPVILGVGRLTRQKDFPTLIRAFARLRERRSARLMILGEGEEWPHLEVLARQLEIDKDVTFAGFVGNPFAFMARARVLALSSAWEGLPGVLVQAMACGCPVVATDCPGGVREIMRDGAMGPLVPVGDFEALAAALDEVMRTPASTSLLRARASEFTAALIGQQYLAILLPHRETRTK